MTKEFCPGNPKILQYLTVLMDLLQYANAQDRGRWAHQSSNQDADGVYGATSMTIKRILIEVYGREIADEVMNSINHGGGSTPIDDLEDAINRVYDRIKERETEKKLDEIMKKVMTTKERMQACYVDLFNAANECQPYVTPDSYQSLLMVKNNLNACVTSLEERFEPDRWY